MLVAFSTTLVSCHLDINRNTLLQTTAVQLSGTWLLQSYEENGTVIALNECEKKETLSFHPDSTVNFIYYRDKESGKTCEMSVVGIGAWKFVTEKQIELNYSTEDFQDIFTMSYTLDGDLLTLTVNDDTASYTERYIKQHL